MVNKRIESINLIIITLVGFLLTILTFKWPQYSIGWFIGGFVGLLNYRLIVYSLRRPLNGFNQKNVFKWKLLRFAIILSFMVIASLLPNIMNIFSFVGGFLMNKLTIIICEIKNKKKEVKINA